MRIVKIHRANGNKETITEAELRRAIDVWVNAPGIVDELFEQVKAGEIQFSTTGFVYEAEPSIRFPLPWRGH